MASQQGNVSMRCNNCLYHNKMEIDIINEVENPRCYCDADMISFGEYLKEQHIAGHNQGNSCSYFTTLEEIFMSKRKKKIDSESKDD